MSNSTRLIVIPAVLLAAACGGRDRAAARVDDALSRDLALAAQAQAYPARQFVSPQELGYAPQYVPGQYPQAYPYGGQPVYAPQQATPVVYRYPAPAPQRSTSRSTGTIYRAPAPAPAEPKRNTKRDAMIGATAGAVAGAAIGRDVKGAIIGAAAGGLLGAVVGHTIDKTP